MKVLAHERRLENGSWEMRLRVVLRCIQLGTDGQTIEVDDMQDLGDALTVATHSAFPQNGSHAPSNFATIFMQNFTLGSQNLPFPFGMTLSLEPLDIFLRLLDPSSSNPINNAQQLSAVSLKDFIGYGRYLLATSPSLQSLKKFANDIDNWVHAIGNFVAANGVSRFVVDPMTMVQKLGHFYIFCY